MYEYATSGAKIYYQLSILPIFYKNSETDYESKNKQQRYAKEKEGEEEWGDNK